MKTLKKKNTSRLETFTHFPPGCSCSCGYFDTKYDNYMVDYHNN